MRQHTTLISLPHYQLEIDRQEAAFTSVDAIVGHLRARIDAHPSARFIGVFDHYAHTSALPDGEIDETVLAAKCVVFCFGMAIPEPGALATRPRSIGVAECADRFVISFLEAPMPVANATMERWALALIDADLPDAQADIEGGRWRVGAND